MKEILKKIGMSIATPILYTLMNIPCVFLLAFQEKLNSINWFLGGISFLVFGFLGLALALKSFIGPIYLFLSTLFTNFKSIFLDSFYIYIGMNTYVFCNLFIFSFISSLLRKFGFEFTAKIFKNVFLWFKIFMPIVTIIGVFLMILFVIRIFYFIGCKITAGNE